MNSELIKKVELLVFLIQNNKGHQWVHIFFLKRLKLLQSELFRIIFLYISNFN